MGEKSAIEWTDATWNPVTGCTKVSAGCLNCYAEGMTKRFQWDGPFVPWTTNAQRRSTEPPVYLHADRLNLPLLWRIPWRVFVNSMSDLFHEAVTDGFIYDVFLTMATADRHTFQVLTKRPERAAKLIPTFQRAIQEDAQRPGWPLPNVWMGVSVENQRNIGRLDQLANVSAPVRFVSLEPLLGPVDLSNYLYPFSRPRGLHEPVGHVTPPVISWVIAGGESGPRARPSDPDWFRAVRDQCQDAGVPFFFKQWGEYRPVEPSERVNNNGPYYTLGTDSILQRVGRRAAGAMLDGREWKEFPGG